MANASCPVVAGVVYLRVDGRQLRARAEILVLVLAGSHSLSGRLGNRDRPRA